MWEVQQYTLCDGWINTWVTYEMDGSKYPTQFETEAEAWAELDDLIETSLNEGMDYSYDDYRVVEVS